MIQDPVSLTALIAAVTALAFWLESRFTIAAKASAALLVILFGAVLSNAGLVPAESPVYDALFGPVTSLAIVWLLFAVRLADLRRAGPTILAAFALAVTATAIGATVVSIAFSPAFGEAAWKLAGVMTGTYSGGGLNFVAVGRELELPPSLFSAAAAADNVVTAVWMGATLALPLWLGRFRRLGEGARTPIDLDSRPAIEPGGEAEGRPVHLLVRGGRLDVAHLTALAALGFGLLWAAARLHEAVPAVPEVLWLTTAALAVGQIPFVRELSGAMPLGYLALHLFFAVLGIASRIGEILAVGPEVLYLTVSIVAIHGILVFGAAWLARLHVATAAVASQAAVGGPSSALALAIAKGWHRLALPGIAAGLLGYAAGNYVGLGIASLVRAILATGS